MRIIDQFKSRSVFKSSKCSKREQNVCHVTPQTKEHASTSDELQSNASNKTTVQLDTSKLGSGEYESGGIVIETLSSFVNNIENKFSKRIR
jgi:hypothetical protein